MKIADMPMDTFPAETMDDAIERIASRILFLERLEPVANHEEQYARRTLLIGLRFSYEVLTGTEWESLR